MVVLFFGKIGIPRREYGGGEGKKGLGKKRRYGFGNVVDIWLHIFI